MILLYPLVFVGARFLTKGVVLLVEVLRRSRTI